MHVSPNRLASVAIPAFAALLLFSAWWQQASNSAMDAADFDALSKDLATASADVQRVLSASTDVAAKANSAAADGQRKAAESRSAAQCASLDEAVSQTREALVKKAKERAAIEAELETELVTLRKCDEDAHIADAKANARRAAADAKAGAHTSSLATAGENETHTANGTVVAAHDAVLTPTGEGGDDDEAFLISQLERFTAAAAVADALAAERTRRIEHLEAKLSRGGHSKSASGSIQRSPSPSPTEPTD